ncbi:MAG: hypothetical protein PHO94_01150 [Petrimonas sp.]|nr:hypothetical protein [Petrimonas sp.]
MTTNLFSKTIVISLVIVLSSCNLFTYSGRADIEMQKDVIYKTIRWNNEAYQEDVDQQFNDFVDNALHKYGKRRYVVLFQSNYQMQQGQRTYVAKLFRDDTEVDRYFRSSDDIIRITKALAAYNFRQRWTRLQTGMPVEEVYKLLPALADYYAKQELYFDQSALSLGDIQLIFDLEGRLIDFKRDNLTAPSAPPARNEEWVF